MWNVKKTIFIDCSVEEVHRFATNPKFWYQWYASLSEAENQLGTGKKGTTMDLKYFLLGRERSVHVLVEENAPVGNGYVWRCLVTGSFDATQTWRYVPKEEGTELHFEMNYELSGNIIGKVANTLYVKKLMSNSIEQTLRNLKDISESE